MAQNLMLGGLPAAPLVDVSSPGTPAGLGWGLGSRQGLGVAKGALGRRQKSGGQCPGGPLVHSARTLAARASSQPATGAVGGEDAFLEEVEELSDGSLVLHYSSEEAGRRKEGRLVSFLTKPLPGQRRREVPKDVLQQILGGAESTHNGATAHSQPQGLASFVKGVLAPSEHNGRATTHDQQPPAASTSWTPEQTTSTGGQASVAAAAAAAASLGAQQTSTAPPSHSADVGTTQPPTAAPSEAGAPEAAPKSGDSPQETSSGQSDFGRVVGVVLAAATFTAVLRGFALALGRGGRIPMAVPMSLYATAAVFALTSLVLWVTGFASGDDSRGAPA